MIRAWIPCLAVWWEDSAVLCLSWEALWPLWSAVGELGAEWSPWLIHPWSSWILQLAGGMGSKVLPVQQLWPGSVPLQPLCTVTGNCFTSPWSPLEHAHNTQTKLCFTSSEHWRELKVNFIYPDNSFVCPRKFDKGLYPDMSPAPLLWSGCLFFLNPFNDRRCNQEAAETWLHNCCQGFSLAALPCVLFAHWLLGIQGFSVNQISPEHDLVRWFVVGLFLNTF